MTSQPQARQPWAGARGGSARSSDLAPGSRSITEARRLLTDCYFWTRNSASMRGPDDTANLGAAGSGAPIGNRNALRARAGGPTFPERRASLERGRRRKMTGAGEPCPALAALAGKLGQRLKTAF